MHIITHTISNAGEPDNVLMLEHDQARRLVRVRTRAKFLDGTLHVLLERTQRWWYVRVDGWERHGTTREEAWTCLPALLTEPDHWQEDEHAPV